MSTSDTLPVTITYNGYCIVCHNGRYKIQGSLDPVLYTWQQIKSKIDKICQSQPKNN